MSQWDDQLQVESASNSWVCVGACTARGRRAANEDAHVLRINWRVGSPPAALCAVMDGHGGSEVSKFLSRRVAEVVRAELDEPGCWYSEETRRQAVENAFVSLDGDVERGVGKELARDSGSTCTVAAVWPEPPGDPGEQLCDYRLMLGNLGDTRGIVVRLGQLVGETQDHKPDLPSEAQRIRDAGGSVITPQRGPGPARIDNDLACARSFGDWRLKRDKHRGPGEQKVSCVPDVFEFQCQRGDVVVIGCDGVFDVLQSSEVAELVSNVIKKAEDVVDTTAIAAAVTVESLERGTTDNVSCVVMRLMDPPVVSIVDWRPVGARSRRSACRSRPEPSPIVETQKTRQSPKTAATSPAASLNVNAPVPKRATTQTQAQVLSAVGADAGVPLVPPSSSRPGILLGARKPA